MPPSAGSVLIVVENLPVPFDRRVWMEATALRDAGWEVAVICPVGGTWLAPFEVIEGIRVYRHPLPPEGRSFGGFVREYVTALRHEFRLTARVRRDRPFDVIHICNPPDLLFTIAAWQRWRHGARVVFDQHDLNPELFRAKYGRGGVLHRLLLLCERATYATAHKVIATNDSYRATALRRGRKSAADVAIVRSGPDLDKFSPVAPEPRFRRGKRHLVGYLGVMGDQEGLDYLLRSVRHVVAERRRDDVHFMLIGGGPALESLRRYAAEIDVDGVVEFTGRVSDEELIARLSSADVCVNPDPANGFNELCTMNKILEYMALGRPIVQFDLLEGRRSAGEASRYVPPNDEVAFGDAIIDLLDDPVARERMSEIGRQRMAEELSWQHQQPALLDAYRSLGVGASDALAG